jgi:hypothetical protein
MALRSEPVKVKEMVHRRSLSFGYLHIFNLLVWAKPNHRENHREQLSTPPPTHTQFLYLTRLCIRINNICDTFLSMFILSVYSMLHSSLSLSTYCVSTIGKIDNLEAKLNHRANACSCFILENWFQNPKFKLATILSFKSWRLVWWYRTFGDSSLRVVRSNPAVVGLYFKGVQFSQMFSNSWQIENVLVAGLPDGLFSYQNPRILVFLNSLGW